MRVETSTGARADLFEKWATPKAENIEKKGRKKGVDIFFK